MATQPHRLDLESVADEWQLALDAAAEALADSERAYTSAERARLRHELACERAETAGLLARLARTERDPYVPWLSPAPVHAASLGLPSGTEACVFDLDGVLTDSAALHAAAWAEVFDDLLLRFAQRLDRQFVPFDRELDYAAYLDGRPRLDGIRAFLRSRGIGLHEGHPEDGLDADTVFGLARRKSEALARAMRRRGVVALPGARRYLEAAGRAGLGRAVVSSSATVQPMLELAGLETLVEASVGAAEIRGQGLRVRPAPDVLLAACRALGAEPAHAVAFAHNPDGCAAAHAAGLAVVAVSPDPAARERLLGFGAERAASTLSALLEPGLRGADAA